MDSSLVVLFLALLEFYFLGFSYFSECDCSILFKKKTLFWQWFLFFYSRSRQNSSSNRAVPKMAPNVIASKVITSGLSIYQKTPIFMLLYSLLTLIFRFSLDIYKMRCSYGYGSKSSRDIVEGLIRVVMVTSCLELPNKELRRSKMLLGLVVLNMNMGQWK